MTLLVPDSPSTGVGNGLLAIPVDLFLGSAGVLLAWLQVDEHISVSEYNLINILILLLPP